MNWDDVRFLLAVGRARNLSEAGRTLAVSHTTVARRLRTLQHHLAVRLLDRTYAAARYLAARRPQERLLVYDAPVAGAEAAWLANRHPGAQVALRSRSTLALAAATAAGGGIAVLPCFVGDVELGLVRMEPPGAIVPSEIWLVVHRDLRRSARAAAVVDLVTHALKAAAPALAGATR